MGSMLAGKVAIVTGASSGIGQAAARLFAEEGAKVVVGARRKDARSMSAMGIALSRSASGRSTVGPLPPSSRITRFMPSIAACWMIFAACVAARAYKGFPSTDPRSGARFIWSAP